MTGPDFCAIIVAWIILPYPDARKETLYENEKISIMTKFKGEKKREIAKEFITKEIVVGKTGGKKR